MENSQKVFAVIIAMLFGLLFNVPYSNSKTLSDSSLKPTSSELKFARAHNFSDWMKKFGEQPLNEVKSPNSFVLRRMALPAFEDPSCIRIEFSDSGVIVETKKKEKNRGGKFQELTVRKSQLTPKESEQLKVLIEAAKPQFLKTLGSEIGNDGVMYLYELLKDGNYYYCERWCPDELSLKNINEFLSPLINQGAEEKGTNISPSPNSIK